MGMIKYEWRSTLSPAESAELADLLQRAAAYDAEPEYSTIEFADVEQAMARADPAVRHLVIWMLPHATAMGERDEPERIAGLLRLVFTSRHAADATVVIDPCLRSKGIITLLLEQVGLDTTAPNGWIGTGAHAVTAWARGNHPAAGRLSIRFLIPRTRRVWKLIRSTESAEGATAAPVLEPIRSAALNDLGWASPLARGVAEVLALREAGRVVGVAALNPHAVKSQEFGRCATVEHALAAPTANAGSRRRLLDGAAAAAREAGLSGVIVYVDSDDSDLVNACRLAGFQHDRTDVRFQLGGSR
jgi:N-acetylglutamate synthase-like GNAT family acetyltransferase